MMIKKEKEYTRDFVLGVTPPKSTRTYVAIPHKALIENTEYIVNKLNLNLKEEIYSTARGGNQLIGKFVVEHPEDSDIGVSIMFSNSYDKSMPVGYAAGGHVFICSNGMVVGDISFKLKHYHTNLSQMSGMIDFTERFIDNEFNLLLKAKSKMKDLERPSKKVSSELVGRMFLEENILTSHQLGIIKKELDIVNDVKNDKINHDQIESLKRSGHFIGGSMWDFYNNITEGLKKSHPSKYIESHSKFHSFMENEIGILKD